MFNRLSNAPNRSILYDLYNYICDIKTGVGLARAYVKGLGEEKQVCDLRFDTGWRTVQEEKMRLDGLSFVFCILPVNFLAEDTERRDVLFTLQPYLAQYEC